MVNLSAQLAEHLELYHQFYASRASVEVPQKLDAPMVQDLYFDTEKPLEMNGNKDRQQEKNVVQTKQADVPAVTYRTVINGDTDFLGQINDRLKTQARRYPHPITNEMEELG